MPAVPQQSSLHTDYIRYTQPHHVSQQTSLLMSVTVKVVTKYLLP